MAGLPGPNWVFGNKLRDFEKKLSDGEVGGERRERMLGKIIKK